MFLMLRQIIFAAMRDALELAEIRRGERIFILNVHRHLGIMRQLILFMIAESQVAFSHAQRSPPFHAFIFPEFVPLLRFIRMAEPFHFHLLELSRAENKVARRYFVAKTFADLRDTKRDSDARGVDDVFEIKKNSLRGFWAEMNFHGIYCTNFTSQHQIELPWLG